MNPDQIGSTAAAAIRFQVCDPMLEAFAALSGDKSALHVSENFARRSAYRRRVVHGMIPIGYLTFLDCFHIPEFRCIPVALSGRFAAPVFSGDRLILSAQAASQERQSTVHFQYIIQNEVSKVVVTRGNVTVVYRPLKAPDQTASPSSSAAMVVCPPEIRNLRLEEIETGQCDGFEFRVTEKAVSAFLSLLTDGFASADRNIVQEQFHIPNLLAIFLFSTSVGVSLPGASATFVEFAANTEYEVEPDQLYRLKAEVSHVSRSTRTVKKRVTICEVERNQKTLIRGKITALVNEQQRRMPTMEELSESTDLGLGGKVVVITGASRGIGETTAKLFALMGAKVVVNYHRGVEDATRVVDEIIGAGGQAISACADVSRADEVKSLVSAATEKYGTVHILVNNAVGDYRPIPFLELSWDEIQKEIDVTVKGAFHCCREIVPLMLAAGCGKIINVSSVAVDNPPRDQSKYVLAKSALVGLTRSLSIELAAKNIQVNMVVPSFVETDLVSHIPKAFRQKIGRDTPMQRHASSTEVAQAIVFLASAFSGFTTGQKLLVTGGGAPYV